MIWKSVGHTLISELVAYILLALLIVLLALAGVTGIRESFLTVLGLALMVIVYHALFRRR